MHGLNLSIANAYRPFFLALAALFFPAPPNLHGVGVPESSPIESLKVDQAGVALNYTTLCAKTDYSCILRYWKIVGARVCIEDFYPRPCLIVENPWPVGIFETTPREYESVITEVNAILTALKAPGREINRNLFKTEKDASSHTPAPAGARATRYAEARVMEFAPPINLVGTFLPLANPCASLAPLLPRYVSELDAFGWRSELLDLIFNLIGTGGIPCDLQWPANLYACAGPWGSYYPRAGWANHSSSVIASYLQMLRAGRVASEPAFGRVTLGPYSYPPFTGHFYQLVHPQVRACEKIGSPMVLKAEAGNGSVSGSYVMIHFAILRRCVGCEPCGMLAEPKGF